MESGAPGAIRTVPLISYDFNASYHGQQCAWLDGTVSSRQIQRGTTTRQLYFN
jgi:hypothetical protein